MTETLELLDWSDQPWDVVHRGDLFRRRYLYRRVEIARSCRGSLWANQRVSDAGREWAAEIRLEWTETKYPPAVRLSERSASCRDEESAMLRAAELTHALVAELRTRLKGLIR